MKKTKKIYMGLLLCLAVAGMSGCGANGEEASESAENAVMGKVTAISETQLVINAFDMKDGGMRPHGTPSPEDRESLPEGEKPKGTPPSGEGESESGDERPEGTPPSEDKKSQENKGKRDGEKTGETKTYQIDDDTKIYKMSGEEKTEITVQDIELGEMVSIVEYGDKAVSITVRDSEAFSNRRQEG